jgi:Bacterial HORMA domain 2
VTTAVRINTTVYSATHVSMNMLRGLKQIIVGCGLDPTRISNEWAVLDRGVSTWVDSGHLKELVLEVFDPSRGGQLVGRFDFTLDYNYAPGGDGELWLDSDAVAWTIKKNGSYPSRCDYHIVADNRDGAAKVEGWSSTSFRSTAGMTKHSTGTAIGGGQIGAGLSYWK